MVVIGRHWPTVLITQEHSRRCVGLVMSYDQAPSPLRYVSEGIMRLCTICFALECFAYFGKLFRTFLAGCGHSESPTSGYARIPLLHSLT